MVKDVEESMIASWVDSDENMSEMYSIISFQQCVGLCK